MSFENYPTDIERMHQQDMSSANCSGTVRPLPPPSPHLRQGTNDYSHAERSA